VSARSANSSGQRLPVIHPCTVLVRALRDDLQKGVEAVPDREPLRHEPDGVTVHGVMAGVGYRVGFGARSVE